MTFFISFDIGIHHFAYSIIEIIGKEFNIIDMDCYDLLENENANKKKLDQDFWLDFHNYIKTLYFKIEKCSICLIEKQMGFRNRVNYKAIQLGSQLMAHLLLKFPTMNIIEYPSTQKTKVFKQSITTWNKRKEWSIEFVYEILQKKGDEISIGWIEQFKKKDDICDTILMILAYNIEKKIILL